MVPAELSVQNVSKQFIQSETITPVLNSLTISFNQANTYAVTGSSGSGKSTLMHILAGIETPSAGSVFFNQQNIHEWNTRQKEEYLNQSIGLMFQQPYLIAELSPLENIILPGLIQKKAYKQCIQEALILLEYCKLEHKKNVSVRSLSGGQQQRVALARALFNKPAFLIADEPTGNLDTKTGQDMLQLLDDCHTTWHMGIIISTHDSYVAQAMQNVYHLENGKLLS